MPSPPLLLSALRMLTLLSVSLGAIAHPTVGSTHVSGEQQRQRRVEPASFQHPAGWHTAADIARVRSLIASQREPWKSAVE